MGGGMFVHVEMWIKWMIDSWVWKFVGDSTQYLEKLKSEIQFSRGCRVSEASPRFAMGDLGIHYPPQEYFNT